jgi:hypothetical protein
MHSISDLEIRQNPDAWSPESSHVVVCMYGHDHDVFIGTKKECEDFVDGEYEEQERAYERATVKAS